MSKGPRTERHDPTIRELYRIRPSSLEVYVRGEDKPKRVAITGGNRWAKLQRTLEALAWERIECLDAKGNVIEALERDDGDDSEIEMPDPVTDAERIAMLCLRVQERTQEQDRKVYTAQMEKHFTGTAELISAMTDGIRALNETYSLALKVQTVFPKGGDDADPIDQQMQSVLMGVLATKLGIPPAMFEAAKAMGKQPPAKPPNGANGTRPPQAPPNGVKP